MTTNIKKTALVTGANSGIGFEASAQLAEAGFGCVILACRALDKAEAAKAKLIDRCGKDVFDVLAVDMAEMKSVTAACDNLVNQNKKIDFLLLNAAMSPGSKIVRNSDGVEMTFASTLIGHHLMTMRLLANQMLSQPRARIVIAGSEMALRNARGSKTPNLAAFSKEHFNGNLEAAFKAIAQAQPPYKYHWLSSYGIAKLFVAWWAAALSRKLPPGQTVNAISPGATPDTNFIRHQPLVMRTAVKTVTTVIAKIVGMAGPVSVAARRYLDAEAFDDHTTGQFFASPPGRLVGAIEIQREPQLFDTVSQEACWNVVVQLAGGVDYPQ